MCVGGWGHNNIAMKKLTHLVNYKTKQIKNVKTYNPFDTGDNNGNDGNYETSHKKSKFQLKTKSKIHNKTHLEQANEPIVHKYSNNKSNNKNPNTTTENAIKSSTKTKAACNKFLMTTKKSKQKQEQQQKQQPSASCTYTASSTSSISSTSRTAYNGSVGGGGSGGSGNNINYASLDRMRNSSCNSTQSIKLNHKRKWPYLWWKRYGRHRKPLTKTWRLKHKQSCWRQLRKKLSCCKHSSSSSSYHYNSDEDDDIDAKFNAYILELKRMDAKEEEERRAKLAKEGKDNENSKTQLPAITNIYLVNNPSKNHDVLGLGMIVYVQIQIVF
ncbi:uncharacterized protein ACRADG_000963 [Cochliomyia hominivorax]